jgi:hypothetical protein
VIAGHRGMARGKRKPPSFGIFEAFIPNDGAITLPAPRSPTPGRAVR